MNENRRKVLRRVLGFTLAGVAVEQTWRHGHDYILTREFMEIEPGKVFRGGWQQAIPLRRILKTHKIKTVIALAHPDTHPLVKMEKGICEENGVNWIHLPIHDVRGDDTRQFVSDQLEAAAKIIGDPEAQPVFFHCHHGVNRASMAHIAYRTMMCGWSLDEAEQEVAHHFGLVSVNHGPDYRHMEKFFDERVIPYRIAQEKAAESTDKPAEIAKSADQPTKR
ncbi:MAG: hypothetical protein RJA81_1257 [Planctomycetota bacterium]|jgi:protein-tyrosine phosphatase